MNIKRKIQQKFSQYLSKLIGKLRFRIDNKIYVSFGENCLTDNILDRNKLKSMATPFSHGRSNVEYILQLEEDNYCDFLNLDYIQYEMLEDKQIARLKKYNLVSNRYHELHENGFEFTHHDVIQREDMREKFRKRVATMKSLIGKKKFIIMYHHRTNQDTDIPLLITSLVKIRNLYSTEKLKAEVVCFTQLIIDSSSTRDLSYSLQNGIHYFTFSTYEEWSGTNPDLLWAKCDDDLIVKMLSKVRTL